MIKKKELTHEYLLQRLDYNSDTGNLIWKYRPEFYFKTKRGFKIWNKRFPNKTAGSLKKTDGYIRVIIDKKSYLAHRLCYFHYHGYMPENEVDHKDRVRHHNWILNLREVSRSCNMRNMSLKSTNKSGITGVSFDKSTGKWAVYIMVHKKSFNLGRFRKFDDAVFVRWNAEVKYEFPNCVALSPAYSYLKNKGLIND